MSRNVVWSSVSMSALCHAWRHRRGHARQVGMGYYSSYEYGHYRAGRRAPLGAPGSGNMEVFKMKGRLLKTTIAGVALVALFATMVATAGAAPKSVGATPGTVTITGAVIGTGGGGGAWWRPVSGATIAVQEATQTATTAADGTYSLTAIGGPLYYSGKAITATHKWYRTGQKLLGGGTFQVTVKSGSRKIKGAKVSCFGKRATTKGTGRATLSGLQLKPLTRYTVKITKSGYKTVSFKALSSPGHTVK